MRVEYRLTSDDFWQCTVAWRKARAWRKWAFRVLPVFCLLLLGLTSLSVWENRQYRTSSPVLVAGAFLMIYAWGRPRLNARKNGGSASRDPVSMQVSDAGLHFASAREDSLISWSAFTGWAEGNSVFALFSSAHTSVPIPKRAFSNEQLDRFREILRRNVGRK